MKTIVESGISFGLFEDDKVFHIEKSDLYRRMNKGSVSGVKSAEFVCSIEKNRIFLVEAKPSSPHIDNNEKLYPWIDDIANKFIHSLSLYSAVCLGMHGDKKNEIPKGLLKMHNSFITLNCILVIKGHKEEWCLKIQDLLRDRMKLHRKIWNFEVIAINEHRVVKLHLGVPINYIGG